VEFTGNVCIVPPNSFALATSIEYFRIPRNVLTICVGKSTYARCGIIVNVTPFEPEWEGFVTLEISNTTPLPARIYANEGIAQVLFFTADEGDECEVSYKDKKENIRHKKASRCRNSSPPVVRVRYRQRDDRKREKRADAIQCLQVGKINEHNLESCECRHRQPADRTRLRSNRNPRNTSPPANSSHQTLNARSPASLAIRPK